MKWLVDIDALVAEGIIDPTQAATLRARARADAFALGTSILLVGGILAVIAGVVALSPTPAGLTTTGVAITALAAIALLRAGPRFRLPANAAAVIGVAAAGGGGIALAVERAGTGWPAVWIGLAVAAGGLALRAAGPAAWRVMAAWAAVLGGAAHLGGVFALEGRPDLAWAAMADAALVLGLLGVLLDIRLLTALAVLALAGTLSAAGYAHASYALAVYEPTLLILMMSAVAGIALALARAAERAARHARIAGLMALVWINIAFWVGSLWGDVVGEYLLAPPRPASTGDPAGEAAWAEWQAAHEAALAGLPAIPEIAFVIGWALLILGTAAWAALTARRSVLNAAATFGAIHFYTQWFERLEAAPEGIIGAGIIAILAAWGMVRANAWLEARADRSG